jgi:hypothetical protein
MQTTETASGNDKKGHPWKTEPEYLPKRWARARRMARQRLWVPADVGQYRDRIARAFAREREHWRVKTPEGQTVLDYTFQCVCCGGWRGDEERREPDSEVCLLCVEDAGFWN